MDRGIVRRRPSRMTSRQTGGRKMYDQRDRESREIGLPAVSGLKSRRADGLHRETFGRSGDRFDFILVDVIPNPQQSDGRGDERKFRPRCLRLGVALEIPDSMPTLPDPFRQLDLLLTANP
jgi:hypothetical protein